MASKGQKFKKVSPNLKKEILYKYFNGDGSARTLGKEYDVSFNTIKTWIRQTKKGVDVTVDHWKGNSGIKKTNGLTREDYKERYEILKKYQAFLEALHGKK